MVFAYSGRSDCSTAWNMVLLGCCKSLAFGSCLILSMVLIKSWRLLSTSSNLQGGFLQPYNVPVTYLLKLEHLSQRRIHLHEYPVRHCFKDLYSISTSKRERTDHTIPD